MAEPSDQAADVETLMAALGARVPQVRERSQAARSLAAALLAPSGVDHDSAAEIETAVALHELGKLYLDRSLLPYPPVDATEAQRRAYEAHFEHGRALAEGAGLSKRVCAAILRARERWDGEGPQHLGGEEIPLGARVVAICREYAGAPALGTEAGADPVSVAASHLESLAGTMLDPDLVAAAVRALDPGGRG